jgi:two-component system cell cycle response regulator
MTRRVLIVEDNPMSRELMDYLLRAYGFETLLAVDGRVGLDVARRERPDLILCDVQMPGLDGLAFAREARQDEALRQVPLIAVTAYAMVGDRNRILSAGFDGYIAKPIDPAHFVDSVNALLPAALRTPTAQPHAPTALAALRPRQPASVLTLDDTPMNLELKRDLLEPNGYQVLTASTMDDALRLATQHRPALIISDVGLREGSGFDFIRRVKADPLLRDIPFMFLTSTHWDPASQQEGLRLGAVRYLLRPIDPWRLLEEVAACIGG